MDCEIESAEEDEEFGDVGIGSFESTDGELGEGCGVCHVVSPCCRLAWKNSEDEKG